MIVITGAAGFVGSYLAGHLLQAGYNNLILVDDFAARPDKNLNWQSKPARAHLSRHELYTYIERNAVEIECCFHIGAKTDTTLFDKAVFDELNVSYSQRLWQLCAAHQIPFIYASSAATYGAGELGYDDDEDTLPLLKPLNPYGQSKQDFDVWALIQEEKPFFWAGLKFFNVYGPNEYHKGRMASVILHAHKQISETGRLKLFRSHHPDFEDGGQMRDFVYVKDLAAVLLWLFETRGNSGIFNLGSGTARTFLDLATNTFHAMGRQPEIHFIDTPEDIRDKYQYFTQANMAKLRAAGYEAPFHTLEQGVEEYVKEFLQEGRRF